MMAEKVNADHQQQDRHPESPQPEKTDQQTGQIGAGNPEKVGHLISSGGMVQRRVRGVVGNQADEGKNHQEKNKDAGDFFAHGCHTVRDGAWV